MNAILGMTHLALKTELTPKQHDYLTKTKAAAQALLGIINDILDFSKIEAGKLTMEQAEFRLDAVLDSLSTVVSQKAQEKNLEFLVAAPQDLPPVLVGDPLRLGQVLINLVNNAVKFTERGEIVVAVKLEERVSDRIKLEFTVHDSGIGMTPEQIARLFQAFSQADTSTTRKYGGTGLGLSISKRLVEMMEGNIWAESEHGQGSTFCFTAWFGVGTAERRQKVLPPRLAGIRVLVVDDNSIAREILADVLRQFTVRVDCVSSGNDALRELAKADTQDPYQLVLMDWQMPGLDGLETSRSIKRRSNLWNVPKLLVITTFGREDIPLSVQETEIEAVLQKPVTPSVLFDTLMNLFGEAADEKAAEPPEKPDRDLPRVSGVRVLLVEDNEVNQQVATELLESEGAKVTIANHGAEAVKLLTQGVPPLPFDIVLMDLQMPEMDGLTATKILRAHPHLQQLPIIAMTAHAMAEEAQRCLDAGMNDHVAKPVDPGTFFATIARWTRAHRREVLEVPVTPPSQTGFRSAEGEIILPQIGGVDVAAGLQRVAGNKRLYRDLLTQFAVKHEFTGTTIRQALASGDRSKAERLTHSLKGAAGNLGLNEIFQTAGKLEGAIRVSQAGIEDLIEELTAVLDRQVRNIHAAFPVGGADEKTRLDSRPTDPEEVLAALANLKELLESNDADAPEAYRNLAAVLGDSDSPSRLEALGAAVNSFDFEAALRRLDETGREYRSKEKSAEMTRAVEKRLLLLVDDDSENVQVVHSILKDRYKICVATNGAKALELAKVGPLPDLILLDVMMPQMDGYEVCGCLKADERTKDTPVIFLTGKTEVANEARGFEVGAVDYIHKPFSPPIVTARVQTHIMLHDARETVARQLLSINSEQEMARQIQLSILPQETPHLQGLEIEARYLPMSSVAGDFYDFLVIDDKHVGVLIADVSGHGLPSALIASMLQTQLAAQAPNASNPPQVLSGLNKALYGKFCSHYVTAAYLYIDIDKGTATYAGAAHPPMLLWQSKTGRTIECLENGLMLGPFSDARYSAITFSLEDGDRIALITDGIIEATDSSEKQFGMERLRQIVDSTHSLPANRFADAVLDGLADWSEDTSGQSDDITLVTIDFKATA